MRPIGREREANRSSSAVEPGSESRPRSCAIRCLGTRHRCTLPRNHEGPHIAHGLLRRTVAVWDSGFGTQEPAVVANRPAGDQGTGIREASWRRLVRTIPPFHDLLFLVFLVAFLGFAIQWALTLSG